jgi:hypothetical protein
MTKQEKVTKLTEAVKSNQRTVNEWTAEDEGKLQWLKCSQVNLADMTLGRQKAMMQQHFFEAGVNMPDNEFD